MSAAQLAASLILRHMFIAHARHWTDLTKELNLFQSAAISYLKYTPNMKPSQVFLTSYSSNPQTHLFFPSGVTEARGKIDFTDMHSKQLKWQLQTTEWFLVRAALRVQLNMKIDILTVFAILSWKMPMTERKGVRLSITICKHKTKNYKFTLQVTGSIFNFHTSHKSSYFYQFTGQC